MIGKADSYSQKTKLWGAMAKITNVVAAYLQVVHKLRLPMVSSLSNPKMPGY
jgi:hypothetical protein